MLSTLLARRKRMNDHIKERNERSRDLARAGGLRTISKEGCTSCRGGEKGDGGHSVEMKKKRFEPLKSFSTPEEIRSPQEMKKSLLLGEKKNVVCIQSFGGSQDVYGKQQDPNGWKPKC